MFVIDPQKHAIEEWRAGVQTRMVVSAMTASQQLCLFEQWCAPGAGAPTHSHTVEEVLTVLAGEGEFWIEDDHVFVSSGQSVVIPARHRHGFRNTNSTELHVQAVLAAPFFEAWKGDDKEPVSHWTGQNRGE